MSILVFSFILGTRSEKVRHACYRRSPSRFAVRCIPHCIGCSAWNTVALRKRTRIDNRARTTRLVDRPTGPFLAFLSLRSCHWLENPDGNRVSCQTIHPVCPMKFIGARDRTEIPEAVRRFVANRVYRILQTSGTRILSFPF